MSLFVGLAPGKGVCVCVFLCDLVVADQNTNGSSEEDAGEWQVCESETHRLGITEDHVKDWVELV